MTNQNEKETAAEMIASHLTPQMIDQCELLESRGNELRAAIEQFLPTHGYKLGNATSALLANRLRLDGMEVETVLRLFQTDAEDGACVGLFVVVVYLSDQLGVEIDVCENLKVFGQFPVIDQKVIPETAQRTATETAETWDAEEIKAYCQGAINHYKADSFGNLFFPKPGYVPQIDSKTNPRAQLMQNRNARRREAARARAKQKRLN